MLLWKLLRFLFLPKGVRKAMAEQQRRPYETSIAAFESDAGYHHALPLKEQHMARKISIKKPQQKEKSLSGAGSAISDILKSADKRAQQIHISPKRKELLDMMRILYRKKQRIFDDLSPHRRETLRLIAEHMLRVNEDEPKH